MAGAYVAVFALRHQTRPAAGYQGAWTGASDARGGVDAPRPSGRYEVLVGAKGLGAVEDCRVSFWGKSVFMRVTTYGGDTFESEIERCCLESGAGEEGNEERA